MTDKAQWEESLPARWEWRCFSEFTAEFPNPFAKLAPDREDRSEERYLLLSDPDLNLKQRYGILDLKRRLAVNQEGYEQWYPIFKSELPCDPSACRTLSSLLPPDMHFSLELNPLEQLSQQPDIRIVDLEKLRKRYTLNGVQAEYTLLTIHDRQIITLALEHLDWQQIHRTRIEYGLQGLVNESYPQALKRVLGPSKGDSLHGC